MPVGGGTYTNVTSGTPSQFLWSIAPMADSASRDPIQRIFLGWGGPALPDAAKAMVETYAEREGVDLRTVVVVTPGARAGRRLGELLLEQAEARGVPLTPPTLVTAGRFPELLYDPGRPLAGGMLTRHAFFEALRSSEPSLLQEVFPRLPRTLFGWMALAGVAEGLHREVGTEGLEFQDVARALRQGFPYDDSSRWDLLARVQERAMGILEASGFGDRDRERKSALARGDLTQPGDLWLVGVVELPSVVKGMLGSLTGPVRALVHAPEGHQDRFDAFGCVIPEGWAPAPVELDDDRIRVVGRPPEQARAVGEILRSFGGRFSAEEVVVAVPDPELVPYLEQGIAAVAVPHRFAGGTPLAETGPVRLLRTLSEYLDGRPYPAFAALLRHPEVYRLLDTGMEGMDVTGPLTVADRFQAARLQPSVEGALPGDDKDAREMRALVDRLEKTLGLESLAGARPLTDWMGEILEILVRVYGTEPADLGKRSVRHAVGSLDRIKDAAGRMALLPDRMDPEVEGVEALNLLLAELKGESIPPDPEEHAVELLGWLELPLDDAPAVVVTGVNDRHLPEAFGADPFLPATLRRWLGLPDDEARYARDAYLLSALARSREEFYLLVGRHTAAGDPLRPSRLLFAASEADVARRVRRFLGDVDREEGEREEKEPPGALRPSRFQSPPVDPLPTLDSLERISVTDFGAYLADPYRFRLERVMNLAPLEDDLREMEATTFGTLAHKVLERFGRSPEAGSPDPAVVEEKLLRLLDRAVREGFGRRPLPAVRVQVEQLRARLRRFARWQAGWVGKGWRIRMVEARPEGGVPFEVDGEAISLRGKIDRIDYNSGTGQWAIFDYKTGEGGVDPEKAHRKGKGKNRRWVDLQLPLYRHLLGGISDEGGKPLVADSGLENVSLGYIRLPKDLDQVGEALVRWSEEELEEAFEEAKRVVRALRTEPFHYDPRRPGPRDDPLAPLLGRRELPQASTERGEEGGEE